MFGSAVAEMSAEFDEYRHTMLTMLYDDTWDEIDGS